MLPLLLACAAPAPPAPAAAGELTIEQLHLGGTIGESTLIIGPDGTSALVDVGNDAHDEELREALERHGVEAPDATLLTHYHADHIGGLDDLVASTGLGALVTRGLVGVGEGSSLDELEEVQGGPLWADRVDLCDESGCELPWTLPLGEGATLTVVAANAWIGGESYGALPDDDDGENARSLVLVVRWGDFELLHGGDLTGGGKGTPDVESFVAARLGDALPASGADLLHLNHHGISSSTGEGWLARALPEGGGERHALVGASGAYLDAPSEEALDALRARLGGGRVWAPAVGALAGEDALLVEAEAPVLVRVTEGGARYTVEAGEAPAAEVDSIP